MIGKKRDDRDAIALPPCELIFGHSKGVGVLGAGQGSGLRDWWLYTKTSRAMQ
ncbi:MAG TPA: hypothetical protein VFU50_01350 [Terriglobales bacterium]|nr:hypothetical protein [Terriglobales bacterium]